MSLKGNPAMVDHLLLDPELCIEVCEGRHPDVIESLSLAEDKGARIWLYAGSFHQIIAKLGGAPKARELLSAFKNQIHWLAALAEDCVTSLGGGASNHVSLETAISRLSGQKRILTLHREGFTSGLGLTPEGLTEILMSAGQASIDFIDLKTQQDQIRPQLESRIHRVLQHGQYILGPEVGELEARLSEYVGVKHCISASSGTDTLLIALMALGVGHGDEVITVPYTWISTAEVISLIGAVPVFVDIEKDGWNMDPELLEAAITPRTRAIMPVGIYGQCPDMDAINSIAAKYNLPVIEDAAQSFGATYHGKKSCSLSTIGSTSFFPSKPLGGYGDGGALFTDDDALAKTMRQIRVHGQERKHYHPIIGINGRCDTLQAAIVLAKLDVFDEECRKRVEVAKRYDSLFEERKLGSEVVTPMVQAGNSSVFAQYTILAEKRDELQTALAEFGIPSVPYYVAPLHLQPAFANLGFEKGAFPVCEQVSDRCLSLPMSPNLDYATQSRIVEVIAATIGRSEVKNR